MNERTDPSETTVGRELLSSVVTGRSVKLRMVKVSDAEFIYRLRNRDYVTEFLQPPKSCNKQRKWIREYKNREAQGADYYFIVLTAHGSPVGTVRLYNVTADAFEWGSWVLARERDKSVVEESIILSLWVGFELLKKSRCVLSVKKNNIRGLTVYERAGFSKVYDDGQDFQLCLAMEDFLRKNKRALTRIGPQLKELMDE